MEVNPSVMRPAVTSCRTAVGQSDFARLHMAHIGSCFCGAVELEVTGAPAAMGYCHCRSCRSWSGGPVNAFSLWPPEAVRITAGQEHVATFQKSDFQPSSILVHGLRRASDGTGIRRSASVDVFTAMIREPRLQAGRARQSMRRACCPSATACPSSRIFPPSSAAPARCGCRVATHRRRHTRRPSRRRRVTCIDPGGGDAGRSQLRATKLSIGDPDKDARCGEFHRSCMRNRFTSMTPRTGWMVPNVVGSTGAHV